MAEARDRGCGIDYLEVIEQLSVPVWQAGLRVLQGHRLAASDIDHVSLLLTAMSPDMSGHVLDIGCGFGEVARLMAETRPDLSWTLLNLSAVQLRYAPDTMARVRGDMHRLPFKAAAFDYAMLCYAFCHARPAELLAEAARVTRPGGHLFIYDYQRIRGDNTVMQRLLHASAYSFGELEEMCHVAGWDAVYALYPNSNDAGWRTLIGSRIADYEALFAELRPMILQATRS